MGSSGISVYNYALHPQFAAIKNHLSSNYGILNIKGVSGSSISLLVTSLKESHPHILITHDKETASYLYHDLSQLNGDDSVFFLPSSYKRSPEFGQPDSSQIILRTEALKELRNARPGQFFVSYTEALMEKVPGNKLIDQKTLTIKKSEQIDLYFVVDFLKELGFKRADFVYEPGYFSVRGSIIDIFSFAYEEPFRIDFFGDEIESIRSFDIENQLSKKSFDEITIIPELTAEDTEEYICLSQSLPSSLRIWVDSPSVIIDRMNLIYEKTANKIEYLEDTEERQIPSKGQLINGDNFIDTLNNNSLIIWDNPQGFTVDDTILFHTSPQPLFHKHFELVEQNIRDRQEEEYRVFILSDNSRQLERLRQIFIDRGSNINYEEIPHALHEGFVDHDLKICLYTDHQIFDRYHKFSLKTDKTRSARQTISLKELTRLNPGDYIVHIDHGIGRFGGLITTEENGHKQEAIQLVYRDNDILLVNIHSLHRISKYKGKEGEPPRINKLGTAAWSKMKEKTKKKVKDIARELISLYARRKAEPGFSYSPDSYLQSELEASFIYEDTPDQYKATNAVKADMEAGNPMDRLVCGDVGFGKTEVAIRAAFKAVTDNKQVAVLVPTTILALQHYHTFRDRLKDFPVNVEYVSRMRKASDIKTILKRTKEGNVNILIGTHRLTGKDVEFKDLGLLIVDEEQRFGVAIKEKLKNIKVNVDTLTLTATPIPRTLQFSLMGARDLSILNTPPPNRHPIYTEIHTLNDELLKDAILYEVERNGQVFLINNRVQNILEIQKLINRILPEIKTVVAHGQMEGNVLEKIMLEFISGEYDVLIATTIIESGLDIPNANTIIINNAHQFGLTELHQLRGRVGRSNKKAFCYLMAPPLSSLTNDARRRLKILEEFSDLGSGFNIAMQDLDIRGAGNMLGGEQSGFIADIGYETYQRILEEALLELRETEYPETISSSKENNDKEFKYVSDCQIETDQEVRFPEDYITNIAERMELYRELDNIKDEEKIAEFRKNITDRFGELPRQAEGMLEIVRLRIMAEILGIEKLTYKNKNVRMLFVSNHESPYYKSETFNLVLQWLQANHKQANMEEKNSKLWLTIPKVQDITKIYNILHEMKG